MSENENRSLDITDDEDIGIGRSLKRRSRSSFPVKGVVFSIFIVFLVVASFWVSFLVGKRILIPEKTILAEKPKPVSTMPVKEVPQSVAERDLTEKTVFPDLSQKPPAKAKPVEKKISKKVVLPTAPAKKPLAQPAPAKEDVYYKVQAGLYSSRAQAVEKMKAMEDLGFEVFAREVSGGWRVQAGAFKSREKADKMASELRAKGLSATVIKE